MIEHVQGGERINRANANQIKPGIQTEFLNVFSEI
jgi:hypothetical protein